MDWIKCCIFDKMKKALPHILSVFLLIYLVLVLIFTSKEWNKVECKGIQVFIKNMDENVFIDETDVIQLINRHFGDLQKIPMGLINKDSIESVLRKNPVIQTAQVYNSLDGFLHVQIVQRKPILRVMTGKGFYVDEEGKMMPLSRKFSARVMVATGEISTTFACQHLYPFVRQLQKDPFWNALVEQIVVTTDQEVLLIPKVGNFRIRIGALEHVEQKMENLYLFLREGIKLKGWNRYKEINLKYENQIVCVKR